MTTKEDRRNRIVLAVILTLAVALVVGANVWKSNLRVAKFTVSGNRIVGTNEILQLVQVQRGTPLYAADLTSVQRNVMSHYYVKSATVERDLPATLHITVVERTPIALVNRNELLYLDEDGVVLPKSTSNIVYDLPVISGIPEQQLLGLGSTVDNPDVIEALDILSTMKLVSKDLYHRISEVQLRNGGDIVLYSAERAVPIIFGHGEIASKLVRLETFWNDVMRERSFQNLDYVDLRYEDQVIARWINTSAQKRL